MSKKTKAIMPENEPKEAVKQAPEPKVVCYVGPSFPGVAHGAVYNNGLPAALESTVAECPAVSGLIIPVDELPALDRSIDGPIEVLYRKVLKWTTEKEV